ncbi:MFS transporter [Anaerovorax odorimutans]|uniref:MFS transporter n=1 Tax=Anaerovorax odorimutans TaxID=109327 RepID=A0ABT1RPH7_9FIRM|nr:MFS transporter [Anaerovorax odorimutans]MCQ4637097.1 MFS transporter [Anaerovorax odorimutans]
MKRILWAILMIAVSTNLPAPLFPVYQQQYGLNPLAITALFAVYAACLLPLLLVSGSLADRRGNKQVVAIGLLCAVLSAGCFLIAAGPVMLYIARVLEGFAVGCFMGTSNAFLVENSKGNVQNALGYASMFNMFGFGFGPLLCGLIAQYIPFFSYQLPFLLLLIALLSALLMLLPIKSEKKPASTSAKRSRISLGVPDENKQVFWFFIAPAAFLMLALNGVVISLVPTYVKTLFHTSNLSYSGVLLFIMLFGSGVAQLIRRPGRAEKRIQWGILFLILGTWGMIAAAPFSSIALLLLSMLLQALGTGWTFQSALRMTGEISTPENRSRIISTFYVCAYSGMAFPTIGIGLLSTLWDLNTALFAFGILLTAAGAAVVIRSIRKKI